MINSFDQLYMISSGQFSTYVGKNKISSGQLYIFVRKNLLFMMVTDARALTTSDNWKILPRSEV